MHPLAEATGLSSPCSVSLLETSCYSSRGCQPFVLSSSKAVPGGTRSNSTVVTPTCGPEVLCHAAGEAEARQSPTAQAETI